MNNIYKVIWSKAKNCYVVASEIARSHTKSATGSGKIGGVTRRSLLASLMALSLLCGGWGAASASLEVVDQSGTAGTVTIYTKDEVDKALEAKGAATDVASNTANIAANKDNINKLDTKKLDKDLANSTFATKDALNDLEDAVNNKVDESVVETALDGKADKADTLAGYGIKDAYTKGDVDNKLNEKADAANVFTKDQTYTRDQVNTKLADYAKTTDVNTALAGKANVGDSYTKAEADGQITTAKNELGDKITANTTKIDANKTAIDDLKTKAATTENTLTNLSGRMAAAESDIDGLQADMATAKSDIGTLKADVSTAKSDINSLKMKDTELTGKIEAEIANRITSDTALDNKINAEIANRITSDTALDNKIDTEIQDRKDAIKATNDRTGGIARNTEGTQTTIEGIVKVDNQGNVKDVKGLSAETITTTGDAAIGGTLGVTGATTLNGALTANGEATFKEKVTVEKDLAVNGKLNVGEIYLENNKLEATGKKHDSATSITADGISNLAKVTELGHTTESQFTHNEKGTFNYAKDGDTTDWKESTSNVTADGVKTEAKDSKGNRTNTSQTASENKTYLEDKDSKNTNSTIDTAKGYDKTIKGENGETSTKQDELNITNTAQKGTITNDAKDIVNNATGNMTNTVGADLTTTVGGNELHEVTGTKTENVTGKVTENYKAGQETNVTGDQDIYVTGKQTNNVESGQENIIYGGQINTITGGQINNITGDQTTTVTGDISNKAKNITNEAETKLTDKVGDNTRVLDSEGITDTVPGADGKGSTFKQRIDAIMGNVKTDAGESEVTQKGDEITSVVGKGEATNSRVTQKKGSLEAAVTDGINTNVSYDVANASAKELTDGTKVNKVLDNLDSSEKTITNGTYKTSKLQTALDITNTAKDGTITNDAKNIVNNATGDMTNTVGGKLTTTVTGQATENFKGGLKTDITGEEIHTVTGNQTNKVTGKQTNTVEGGQENIISGGQINNITGDQTTTISGTQTTTATDINRNASSSMVDKVDNAYGTNTETKEAGKTTTDVSIKGTGEKGQYIRGANESRDYLIKGTLKNSETKTAEATSTEITDGTNKASTRQDAKNLAGSVTNGTETGISGIHANDDGSVSIDSAVAGGGMSSVINQKKDSIQSAVGDGTNSTVIHQDKDNVTIASSNGTVAIVGKDIVNNASESITNKAKTMDTTVTGKATESYGELDTTVTGQATENFNGGLNTKVTGAENHTVTGKQTNTVGGGQINNITGDQTTTVTGMVTENYKAGQATNVTGNQDIHVTGKQTNKIDGNQENTIGGDQTTNVTGDILNTAKNITNAATETLTDKVGTNTRVINSRSITDTVGGANRMIEDGKITDNAGDFTVTTDKGNGTTFTNAGSTASSFTTVDGTNTGSAQGWTNVKGNEISTGKVEANYVKMDYADVMNDLGVKGTTTTKTLKVTENATVGGTLDVTKKATFHDDVDITKNLSVGGNATITGDVTANSYKVGDKTYISADGINANNQKITNVADGSISEGSKDAVNGGQLYGVKRDLEHQVDKVGANAAAMANLRPMEFDPSSKWNIAAAIGNYGSETAAAIGAFYRPNDNVMVNLSTAFGTGENMVGGGVSVRLGKGGNKLSREETNALKAQVADLTARMDALLSVLNPNMSKDFPDVPENHWAYEAVSRLAGNDIVQGYPDGEFHGERTMTRYEMAEIIYNALSRGAEAERKLVEEFKPELQAMAASEKSTAKKAEG